MKQILKYTAVILSTLMGLLVLWQFKLVLLLLVLSLFIAAAIRPFAERFVIRGLPQGAAQLLLYVVGLGSFVVVLLLAGNSMLQEFNDAANRVVLEYESLHHRWQSGEGWQQTAVSSLPPPFTFADAQETDLEQMAPAAMRLTLGLAGALGAWLLLLALSIYWSVDQHRFERLWLSLLPAQRRAYTRTSWRNVETAVGNYISSQTIQSLLAALLLAAGSVLLGFKYPLLLAFVGALAAFVPLFGGVLTGFFALALGSLAGNTVGAVTAVYTLLVFLGLELVVEPRLWPRKRRSFLLMILVILPLFEALGVWGLLAAPPLAAALEALAGQAYQAYLARRETVVQLDGLEGRYQQLALKVAQAEDATGSPELKSLNQRLADLLARCRQIEKSQ